MNHPNQNPPPPVPPVRGVSYVPPPAAYYAPQMQQAPPPGGMFGLVPYKNIPALVGYYLGIFSILPIIGILMGAAAVVLGILGLKKVGENPAVRGKAHAIIAIACGAFFGLIWLLIGSAILFARR